MAAQGPIIFIDDDEDDQEILTPILQEIDPQRPVIVFTKGQDAIDYFRTTTDKPFLIISEVSLHGTNGLEVRRQIEMEPGLRKKSIPFIFFTHPVHRKMIEEAYDLTIQGFFEKKSSIQEIRTQLEAIIAYWSNCLHPNRFDQELE